jgi:Resolvase, N terminal domain
MLKRLTRGRKPAFAYLRGSDAEEQRTTIRAFADAAELEIVKEFHDRDGGNAAGFAAGPRFVSLLRLIELNGISTVIVDKAARIAEDRLSLEVGILKLQARGIEFICAENPLCFARGGTASTVLQVLEISAAIDAVVGAALARGVDKRKSVKTGSPWRKTYAEAEPRATLMAKRLHQNAAKRGGRISLREISAELAVAGCVQKDGKPFHPEAIRRMLKGNWPRKAMEETIA